MRILLLLAIPIALIVSGCNTTPVQDGAVVGGALGAGLGAIVGNQSSHTGEGALIGAGAGALTGALVGDQYEKQPTRTYRKETASQPSGPGHWETRAVRAANGETYEQRIWVPDR